MFNRQAELTCAWNRVRETNRESARSWSVVAHFHRGEESEQVEWLVSSTFEESSTLYTRYTRARALPTKIICTSERSSRSKKRKKERKRGVSIKRKEETSRRIPFDPGKIIVFYPCNRVGCLLRERIVQESRNKKELIIVQRLLV